MADMSDRTNKQTSLTTFAERVMGRWSQTPMSATVQRAIRLTEPPVSTPLTRATATEGFIQRVTQPKTTVAVWKPSATTKQTAIEGFTDALIQRFPDISGKYVARTEESASAGQPELIHSGSTNASTGNEGSGSDSTGAATSEAFDVNKLPSIPAEVLARHKAGLQRRAEASGTSSATAPAPRAVQRKSTPATPQLVRPRSKVEYFGSKADPVTPLTPASAVDASLSLSEPTSASPVQAKAEEPIIQETTPLEEPKWRTRPRAGFQSIPTRGTEGGASSTIPYQPIQAQRSTTAESGEASVESGLTVPSASNPGTTAIQRVVDSSPDQADDGDDTGLTPPPDTIPPPDGPPPPPAPSSLPPGTTLQRAAAPESESPEMPLRAKPQAAPPVEGATEPTSESALPSLSMGVPAKAIRRTSQTPPILRKPIVPSVSHPQTTSVSDAPASPTIHKGIEGVTPVQRQATPSAPMQRVVTSSLDRENSQEATPESLYENQELSVLTDATVVSPAPLGTDAPVQRQVEGNTGEAIVAEPIRPTPVVPDRNDMPLRTVESPSVPTLQRQIAEENSAPVSIKEVDNLPETLHLTPPDSLSVGATASLSRPEVSPPAHVPSDILSSTSAPIQRKSDEIPSFETSSAPVSITNTAVATPKSDPLPGTPSPVQRVTADPRQPEPTIPGRDEMPLRAVEPATTEASVAPVQRKEEALKQDSSQVEGIARSASTSTESPRSDTSVQRVASEAVEARGEPKASTPSSADVTSSMTELPEAKISVPATPAIPVVPTYTPPVQKVAAAPSTSEIPSRADMPLRVEDSTAPVQRKSEATSIEVNSSTVDSIATGESVTPVVSQTTPHVATGTELPTGAQAPAFNSNEASVSQNEKSSVAPLEPIQRVVADIAPATPTLPTQADMPLRREEAGPSSVVQQQVDPDEPVNTTALSLSNDAPQPRHDIEKGTAPQDSQPIARLVQRTVDVPSSTDPVQRVLAEIAPPSPTLPSTADMPLRREESHGTPPVQRQAAPGTGQASSLPGEQPQLPLQRVTNEGNQRQPSNVPTAPGRQENTPAVQRKVIEGSQTQPPSNPLPEKRENDPTSHPPVQPKAADTHHVSVLSEVPPRVETPSSHSALQRVSDDSETLQIPVQRVSGEFAPTSPALPTQADMPLRVETNEAKETTPVQRVSQVGSQPQPVSDATPLEERGNTLPTQPPLQQMESTGENSQAPVQRVSAEIAPPIPALPTQSDIPLRMEMNEVKETTPVQRVSGEIAPYTPALPTQSDMPLRVETGNTKATDSVQRVADENILAQPINDAPSGVRGEVSASQSPVQRTANQENQIQPSSDTGSFEKHDERPAFQPVQRMVDEGNSTQISDSERVSGDITPNAPTLPAQTDMPLRVNAGDVSNTPLLQRFSNDDDSGNSVQGGNESASGSSSTIVPAFIQRKALSPTDNAAEPGTPAIHSFVEPKHSSDNQPMQRVIAEVTPTTTSFSTNVEMPLRHAEGSETPHAAGQKATPSPIQRLSIETSEGLPLQENQEPQAQGASLNIESPVSQPAGSDTPAIQHATPSVPSIDDTRSISAIEPTVQRITASIETTGSDLPTQADMPLRETTAPTLQRQAMPLENNSTTAEPSNAPSVAPLRTEENRTVSNPQVGMPTLPTVQTGQPLQRPVSNGGMTADIPKHTPIQRKPAVKAAHIRRSNSQSAGPNAMPIALMQRRSATTAGFDNPTLDSLAPPSASTGNETTRLEAGSELSLQRVSWDQAITLPLQPVSATPVINPTPSLTSDAPVRVLRRAPITGTPSPLQRVGVPPAPQSSEMPLVQRAETNETVVEPEEQQEVNIDLSSYFSDNNNASGDGTTEVAKAMGGAEKKTPTESDALKALQTLADEIYPLIKQMVARERERHRGF